MHKKKVICGVLILFICSMLLVFYAIHYSANNKQIKNDDDIFRFCHTEDFNGNRWELFVNSKKKKLCSFIPLDGMTKKEMMNKLCGDIIMIYKNQKVRVYCITDYAYYLGQNYPIIYTLNGVEFYLWNADVVCSEEEIVKRLEKLYGYILKEELKEVSDCSKN